MINNIIYEYGWGGFGCGDVLDYRRCGLIQQGLCTQVLMNKNAKLSFCEFGQ